MNYTINYLTSSGNENRLTEEDLRSNDNSNTSQSSEQPYNDKTLNEIRLKNFGPKGMKDWAVNSDTTQSDLYRMNSSGEFYDEKTLNTFVAYTDPKANFWNGRSSIHYSKSVFSSPERILKTMNHESVHAFGNSPAGMTFRLARQTKIDGIDLEHLAIRKAEWSFLNANSLTSKGMNVLSKEAIEVMSRQLDSSQRNIFNIMFKYINPMFSKKIVK